MGPYVIEGGEVTSTETIDNSWSPSVETGDSNGTTSTDTRDCTFDTRMYQIVHCDGHKVDVIEKGFKNTHRLFLTTADLEEK